MLIGERIWKHPTVLIPDCEDPTVTISSPVMIGKNYRQHPTVGCDDPIKDPTATISSPIFIGEINWHSPTVIIPDPTATNSSPLSYVNVNGVNEYPYSPSLYLDSLESFIRYLPSNEFVNEFESSSGEDSLVVDSFASDEFRMYEFKVRRCTSGRSHDWTECPFAHPGEIARRRDPKKFRYSGTVCSEYRNGASCRKGDSCEFAHGVFECWLHPSRYRTQPCKEGTGCTRRVCFFAHTPDQLRVLPVSPESAPNNIGELISSLNDMKMRRFPWPIRSGLRSPVSGHSHRYHPIERRTSSPTEFSLRESPPMEVVESGKEIRARMYARLSKENSLG